MNHHADKQKLIIAENSWQHQLKTALTCVQDLLDFVELSSSTIAHQADASSHFPLIVPLQFAKKIQKGNPNDPLLLQVLPQQQENTPHPDYSAEPLQETKISTHLPKGLLHKYHGRALLILAGKCAINCRYCFRRNFPYADNQISAADWQNILRYITKNPSITEVIFSGGEPLLVSDKKLASYIADLANIPHLNTLRIHTRLPVVIPERLTASLLDALRHSRLLTIIVLHINHSNEIDQSLKHAIHRYSQHSVRFLNQSVLLKGVNDNPETLAQLSHKLYDYGIAPYYLHALDKVSGAQHFYVNKVQALRIHDRLRSLCSGYLVPQLVIEIPQAQSKTPVIQTH